MEGDSIWKNILQARYADVQKAMIMGLISRFKGMIPCGGKTCWRQVGFLLMMLIVLQVM